MSTPNTTYICLHFPCTVLYLSWPVDLVSCFGRLITLQPQKRVSPRLCSCSPCAGDYLGFQGEQKMEL